jgi:hypothetical protein
LLGDHAADVGDESTGLGQRGQGGPHQPEWPQDVGQEEVFDHVVIGVGKWPESNDSRGVHQAVEAAVRC